MRLVRLFVVLAVLVVTDFLSATLARAQVPGGLDATYNPNVDGNVNTQVVLPDGKTIIGGLFTTVGGAAHKNIARLNADGSVDAAFTTVANREVFCIAVQTDGKLVIAGQFTSINGSTASTITGVNCIARLNPDGTLDSAFNTSNGVGLGGTNSGVECLALQADGKIVIGGTFSSVNGSAINSATGINNIARLNPDGTLDTAFNKINGVGLGGVFGYVSCVAVQPDGKIVIGGSFAKVNGSTENAATGINDFTRLNADGTLDTTFNKSNGVGLGGANNNVNCVAVQPDGKLVLGGHFTSINGSAVSGTTGINRIARLNADGTLDTTFNKTGGVGLGGVDDDVFCIAVQADGMLVLGGRFTTVNGSAFSTTTGVNRITRLNANGSRDTTFNRSGGVGLGGANDRVYSVAMQADGKMAIAGFLTSVNGTARNRVARLDNTAATQTLVVSNSTQVLWTRGGTSQDVSQTTFELSTDGGATWAHLGGGTRVGVTANWQLTGLSLPSSGRIRARGRTPSGFQNGSSGLVESVAVFDIATLAPTLAAPVANAVTASPVAVSFTLPEAALPGSVKLTFTGSVTTVLTLAASQETMGAHSFSFNPAAPTGAAQIASGAALQDGVYTVTLGYRDVAGNPVATSASAVGVRIDSTAPTLSLPANITAEATGAAGAVVNYVAGANDAGSGVSVSSFTPVTGSTFAIGTTTVNASATDIAGNVTAGAFTVTVEDTTAPVVAVHVNVTVEATSAAGAVVNYEAGSASDAVGVTSLTYSQNSGTVFPIGTTLVTMTAKDAADNAGTGAFTVTVQDTTAPVVAAHANVTVEATSAAGAVVNYEAGSASDAVGVTTLTYSQNSGTVFPIGTTLVTMTAKDAADNTGTGAFTVMVVDTTAPVVAAHANVTVEATSGAGAVVNYDAASASDAVGVTSLTYSQNSGTVFPIGTTLVTMTAKDAADNTGTGAFTVTVEDTTAPVVAVHVNVTVEATSAAGAVVNYEAGSASDAVGVTSLTYSQNSGTVFPIGTTLVTMTAKDAADNAGTGAFTVTVVDTTAPVVAAHANVTVEATSAAGAVVNYEAGSASDAVGVTALAYSQNSGTVFPIGTTLVTITAKDAADNTGTGMFTVTVVDTTAPVVAGHANVTVEATSAAGAVVNYEAGSASDAVGVTTLTYSQNSGTVFPIGTTLVTMTAKDAADNTGTGTFTVTVEDTTNPTIGGSFSPLLIVEGTPLADYTAQAVTSDVVAVTGVTQVPAAGTATTPGPLKVRLTAHDAAGNSADVSFNVKVALALPLVKDLAGKGGAVPGAENPQSGIAAGAVWDSFGAPSINDSAQSVVLATYKVGREKSVAIVAFDPSDLEGSVRTIVKKGDEVPGIPGAIVATLGEPLLGPDGAVAFTAKLSGAVKSTDNQVVCVDTDGGGAVPWEVIARTGRASWSKFTSVALGNHAVGFTATQTNREKGLWLYDRGDKTTQLKVLTGELLDGSAIKTIHALVERPGSPGQGRGVMGGRVAFRVTLANREQAVGTADTQGPAQYIYKSDGILLEKLGIPTQNGAGALAFQATQIPSGETDATVAILAEDDASTTAESVVATGGMSAGVSGGVFAAIKDPVSSLDRDVAFFATLQKDRSNGIGAANNDGIWRSESTGGLQLVAREGAPAAGTPAGTLWKSFTSLALPEGRGPIFVGKLAKGGAKGSTDTGLWATDSFGALRLLLREGDAIGASTVKTFTALSNVPGSPSQARSFDNTGSVIVRVTDTKGAQHLVHIAVP